MTDLRTAAQQALEALKDCVKALDALHAPGDSIYTRASDSADRAEIALRAALAQQEQEPVAWRYKGMMGMPWSLSDDGYYVSCKRDNGYMVEPLYTQPPRREPEQEQTEPVLVVEKEPDYMSRGHFYEGSKPFIDPTEVWKLPIGTKLYTQPPCREWQSLADEDMENLLPLYSDPNADAEMLEFAAAIEAKLKEKNA